MLRKGRTRGSLRSARAVLLRYRSAVNREAGTHRFYLLTHTADGCFVVKVVEDVTHPASQITTLPFLEATGGDCGGTNAQARSHKRRARVIRDSVLVHGDVRFAKRGIGVFTSDVLLDQTDQEQVVLGATGNHVKATRNKHFGHGRSVLHHLLLV